MTNNKKHDIIIIESKEREVMIMTEIQKGQVIIYMDAVIKAFGFEDKRTIEFCTLCERTRDFYEVQMAFHRLMG